MKRVELPETTEYLRTKVTKQTISTAPRGKRETVVVYDLAIVIVEIEALTGSSSQQKICENRQQPGT